MARARGRHFQRLILSVLLGIGCFVRYSSAAEEAPRNESVTPSPLSKEERDWVTEIVAPLISPTEKKLYLGLPTPAGRTSFRAEFWRIRERDGLKQPFGPGFHGLYLRRLEVANDEYGGWNSDSGRIVLALGEPASVVEIECPSVFRSLQIWIMQLQPDRSKPPRLVFYRDFEGGPLKLWSPILGAEALLSPNETHTAGGGSRSPGTVITPRDRTLEALFQRRCSSNRGPGEGIELPCAHECEVLWPAIIEMKSQGNLGALTLLEETAKFPSPPEADWSKWRERSLESADRDSGKPKLPIAIEPPRAEPPSSPAQKLTHADRERLQKEIPEKYRQWLSDVSLIITSAERDTFLQVKENIERDRFIEEFWRRRSVDKDGIRTNFQELYRERVEYAKENFRTLSSDAAKIYILNGPPDGIVPIDCTESFVPIRIWYYERIEALRSKAYLIFYKPYGLGDWKLWLPADGVGKLGVKSSGVDLRAAETQCFDARTLAQAVNATTALLGNGISGMAEAEKMFVPPPVETEGIDRFLGLTTQISAGAADLAIDKMFLFPEIRDSKMACDISVLLPRKDLAIRDLGDQKFYDIDLIGEVIQHERILDNFKYRFDIPIDEVGEERLPLTMRRYLYPGEYEIRLKAADANRKAEGRLVLPFHVPEEPDAPRPIAAAAVSARPAAAMPPSDFRPSSISILPPVRDLLTGLQRFETRAAEGIFAVDFYLDGTKMMTRTRAPFEADLSLGPLPRRHAIKVVAYDRQGRSVGEDELTINEGSESFRVKIISPRKGATASGPTTVIADATAPEGKRIARMDFYSNELKIATLFQPPWQQLVPVRSTGSLGYVRVVGTLDDGLVAEDLRYVNAPAYISEVNVDAVELYTTVTRGNRPVDGLTQTNFKVLEDGKEQQIAQFEHVSNLPVTVGVAIDTSASMIENLSEAETAAVEFIDATVGEKDRAFTMSFDDSPYTLCRLTANRERLDRSFAGLRAEGSTALYDAIVYGLFQFQGVKGKKALVLLTDGKDTTSRYDFDTLLDYVKKAGVAVYGIGLNISGSEIEVKSKLNRLAEASGGSTFFINNTKSLKGVYKQINEELRSQYLLTYYSSNGAADNKWRRVEVKTVPSTLTARTISGYYP
jgi:Ca-activated chloride channel family protein